MSGKTFKPTLEFYKHAELLYRYMRFICSIKKINLLDAYVQFAYRYKALYSKKAKSKVGRLQESWDDSFVA